MRKIAFKNFEAICLSRPYHFRFFKGCLPQILLGQFLNTMTYLRFFRKCFNLFHAIKGFLVAKSMELHRKEKEKTIIMKLKGRVRDTFMTKDSFFCLLCIAMTRIYLSKLFTAIFIFLSRTSAVTGFVQYFVSC